MQNSLGKNPLGSRELLALQIKLDSKGSNADLKTRVERVIEHLKSIEEHPDYKDKKIFLMSLAYRDTLAELLDELLCSNGLTKGVEHAKEKETKEA